MPWPRLPGSGVEKILFSEEFVGEAVSDFCRFRVEGGYEGLCLLCGAYGSLSLDRNYRGVGRGCFRNSCVSLWAKSGDVPFLVALEAESTLDPLSFFLVRKGGACPSSPYVHGVGVSVVECVPPLWFRCSSSSVVSPDSFLEEYVFLLVVACRPCPVVPGYGMVKLYAICH